MHTPTLHSVLILMNVSRINSKPLRYAVLILQPVNRISYFLSAFSLLHFTIMLHSILKAIVHKIYRQMMEQGHPTETGLLSRFSPLFNPTQAIYGTFILFQSLNAYPFCSLRHWIQKPTQNQCYPDIFPPRLYTNQNHAGHSAFSLFSYFNHLEIRNFSTLFHTKLFRPGKFLVLARFFQKKSP